MSRSYSTETASTPRRSSTDLGSLGMNRRYPAGHPLRPVRTGDLPTRVSAKRHGAAWDQAVSGTTGDPPVLQRGERGRAPGLSVRGCASACVGPAPALADYLTRCGLQVESGASGEVVLVTGPAALSEQDEDHLLALSAPVLFLQPTASTAVTDAAGLVPGALTPPHETRVRPGPDAAEVMHRSGGDLVLRAPLPVQEKVARRRPGAADRQCRVQRPPGGHLAAGDRSRHAHRRRARRAAVAPAGAPADQARGRSVRRRARAGRPARLRRHRPRAQRGDHADRGTCPDRRLRRRTQSGSPPRRRSFPTCTATATPTTCWLTTASTWSSSARRPTAMRSGCSRRSPPASTWSWRSRSA